MKQFLKIMMLLVFIVSTVSCKNDHYSIKDVYHTWEATNFISVESVAYPKNEGKQILLTIKESDSFQLLLDVNTCSGTVSVSKDDIEFGPAACTKVCCDSEFSTKLSQMLPQVKSYSIEGEKLHLTVPEWGFIELSYIE